jgi:hypothetical protein
MQLKQALSKKCPFEFFQQEKVSKTSFFGSGKFAFLDTSADERTLEMTNFLKGAKNKYYVGILEK